MFNVDCSNNKLTRLNDLIYALNEEKFKKYTVILNDNELPFNKLALTIEELKDYYKNEQSAKEILNSTKKMIIDKKVKKAKI